MEFIPTLYYFVGLPGSGKSYQAKLLQDRIIEKGGVATIVSSDALRKQFYGDEACQDNPAFIFDTMREITVSELKKNVDVIYDATNMVRSRRISFLKSLPKCKKVCYIIWAKLETCIERDKNRDRTVGEDVIMKMVKQFQTPWYDEGWEVIRTILQKTDKYSRDDFNLDVPHNNPHHPNTIKEHTLQVFNEVEKLDCSEDDKHLLKWVALHHDIGKIFTKSFKNSRGEVTDVAHFYNHQNVSAYIALGMDCLLDNEKALEISYLCNMHMEPFFNESRYYKNMNSHYRKLVEIFNECDKRGA